MHEKNSILVALQYVHAKLNSLTIPVVTGAAPETVEAPFILVDVLGDSELTSYSYGPVLGTVEVAVLVVGHKNLAELAPYVETLDPLLRREYPTGSLPGVIAECERVRDQFSSEHISGLQTWFVGGVYRITVT